MKIPLAKPDITKKEIDAVVEVMKSGILSIGPKVEEFEQKIASYVGTKHAVAVSNGTSGLHLLVKTFGIGDGDEVITTPFSFIASTNCFIYERAVPIFADIDPVTLEIDFNQIEAKITDKTKAILAVDVFGHPLDMVSLRKLADKYNLILIEDACEAIGAEYDGVKAGSLADGAVFAFYPNKQITTGEGGMIVTNSDEVAERCRILRNQGRTETGTWLHHTELGYNYRLNELSAVIGSVQMDRIDYILRRRDEVAQSYNKALGIIEGVNIPFVSEKTTMMSWFVYCIKLDEDIDRDAVLDYLVEHGVQCKPYFTPIHIQPFIKDMYGCEEEDYPHAAAAGRSCLALPFYNDLSDEEIAYVADMIRAAISRY